MAGALQWTRAALAVGRAGRSLPVTAVHLSEGVWHHDGYLSLPPGAPEREGTVLSNARAHIEGTYCSIWALGGKRWVGTGLGP